MPFIEEVFHYVLSASLPLVHFVMLGFSSMSKYRLSDDNIHFLIAIKLHFRVTSCR